MGGDVEVVKHTLRPRGMGVFPAQEVDGSLVARPKGFRHLPRRWVVERTIAWIGRFRRLSKDYEFLPASSEAMVYLTMIRVLLARLAKQEA
jgi:transposase